MKKPRSSRHLIKTWHRREKATIDHLVRIISDKQDSVETIHSAFTPAGLAIEDQVRKAWSAPMIGLAIF
jgi:hypothetical protein